MATNSGNNIIKLDKLSLLINASEKDLDEAGLKKACELIEERCKSLETDDDRLSFRLKKIKKMTKQRERDVEILKARLDNYGDCWRTNSPNQ